MVDHRDKTIEEVLAANLRYYMQMRGETHASLAKKVTELENARLDPEEKKTKVIASTISHYTAAAVYPRPGRIRSMAEILKCNENDLVSYNQQDEMDLDGNWDDKTVASARRYIKAHVAQLGKRDLLSFRNLFQSLLEKEDVGAGDAEETCERNK